ncbi:MAG: hypothetical protein PF445_10140 [Melioribacteraceae bacterium]|nr:hypothetical protein [Melioribacteraceae bacterium]
MTNKFHKILLFLLSILVVDYSVAQDSSNIKRHLEYLGSDPFEGRESGTIVFVGFEIFESIENNKNGIGFGGIGKDIKLISVNGIEPNSKNTKDDNYPLTKISHISLTIGKC